MSLSNVTDTGDIASAVAAAAARARAWRRALDAIAEMREALDHRIWLADPADRHLEADCQAWCELSRALADFFLKARR